MNVIQHKFGFVSVVDDTTGNIICNFKSEEEARDFICSRAISNSAKYDSASYCERKGIREQEEEKKKFVVEGSSADEGVWQIVERFESRELAENYIADKVANAEGWDGEYKLRLVEA